MASAALMQVTLELCSRDTANVMTDADIDQIAERLFWAAFLNNEKICVDAK